MPWRTSITKKDTLNSIEYLLEANKYFIVLDCETSGLSADKNFVTQLSSKKYAVEEYDSTVLLKEVEVFDSYINIHQPLEKKISEITGITDEILRNAPDEKEVFLRFKEFVGDNGVFCGQNVSFDIRFIEAMYQRQKSEFKHLFILDTLKMAKDLIPYKDTANYKLSTLAKLYNVDEGLSFHNSLDDVEATARLAEIFINEYKKREEELKNQPLKPLIKPDVTTLKYWKGYKGFSRIYINTTDGSFYYDVRKKEWGHKQTDDDNRTLSDFDMEHIRRDAFSKLGVTTEEQFARWKGEAY